MVYQNTGILPEIARIACPISVDYAYGTWFDVDSDRWQDLKSLERRDQDGSNCWVECVIRWRDGWSLILEDGCLTFSDPPEGFGLLRHFGCCKITSEVVEHLSVMHVLHTGASIKWPMECKSPRVIACTVMTVSGRWPRRVVMSQICICHLSTYLAVRVPRLLPFVAVVL